MRRAIGAALDRVINYQEEHMPFVKVGSENGADIEIHYNHG